jgi:putative transposase
MSGKGLGMTPTEALRIYLETRGLTFDRHYLRDALRTLAQALMETEVSRMLDAGLYERNDSRRAYRNGYRASIWRTRVGDITLQIPKLRKGTYYPLFLNPSAEATLQQLAQDAFVTGVEWADVKAVLDALGLHGLQPPDVADITERLADVVYSTHNARIHIEYPALFLDVLDVEEDGYWRQLMIVLGVQPSGVVDLLAHELVSVADDRAWTRMLRRLQERGLTDVELAISSDTAGTRTAVSDVLVSAVWQHHRNFLLRGMADDVVVNAVSSLAVRVESEQRSLPRMHLAFELFGLFVQETA